MMHLTHDKNRLLAMIFCFVVVINIIEMIISGRYIYSIFAYMSIGVLAFITIRWVHKQKANPSLVFTWLYLAIRGKKNGK